MTRKSKPPAKRKAKCKECNWYASMAQAFQYKAFEQRYMIDAICHALERANQRYAAMTGLYSASTDRKVRIIRSIQEAIMHGTTEVNGDTWIKTSALLAEVDRW